MYVRTSTSALNATRFARKRTEPLSKAELGEDTERKAKRWRRVYFEPETKRSKAGKSALGAWHERRSYLSVETPQQSARSNSLLRCPNLITTAI